MIALADTLLETATNPKAVSMRSTIKRSCEDDVFCDVPSTNYDYVRDSCTSISTDDPDADNLADQKLHKIFKKIESTKDDLIRLQAVKDDNVSEYLKSIDDNETDAATSAKIKLQFERNNQRTNVSIQLLQKKLEKYQLQVKEIEEHGVHGNKPLIKLVQDHVRSGASSISDAVTKPLESLNNFIKKEKKNSFENVFQPGLDNEEDNERNFYRSTTSDEEHLSSDSTSNLLKIKPLGKGLRKSAQFDEDVDILKDRLEKLEDENKETKENVDYYKDGLNRMLKSLQDERHKTEQIQAVLNDLFNQWNDLIELHQNEMRGVKEEMEHTLERIECVEYRFTERTAELHESVENCLTRISKQEIQSQELQQPIDTYMNMDGKILLSKFVGFFINICVVGICIFSSLTKLVLPFVSNKVRLLTTVVAIVSILTFAQTANYELVSIFVFMFILVNCIYMVMS